MTQEGREQPRDTTAEVLASPAPVTPHKDSGTSVPNATSTHVSSHMRVPPPPPLPQASAAEPLLLGLSAARHRDSGRDASANSVQFAGGQADTCSAWDSDRDGAGTTANRASAAQCEWKAPGVPRAVLTHDSVRVLNPPAPHGTLHGDQAEGTMANASHAWALHRRAVAGLGSPATPHASSSAGAPTSLRHVTARLCTPPPQGTLHSPNGPTAQSTSIASALALHARSRHGRESEEAWARWDGSRASGHSSSAVSEPSLHRHATGRHCTPWPHGDEQGPQEVEGAATYERSLTSTAPPKDTTAAPSSGEADCSDATMAYCPTGVPPGITM